jgi:putative nucleotidyltransferase with HDIG domain
MGDMGARVGPVGRFSISLAVILALTAVVVALATSFFIGRYVEDETKQATSSAVAGHFGTVFQEDIFLRQLAPAEMARFEQTVGFHLGVYDVVSARFLDARGQLVYEWTAAPDLASVHALHLAGIATADEPRLLELRIPVQFADGVRATVVVARDMARVDEAVRMMQGATSAIIAVAAVFLWLILRGVYVRSSNEIRRRSRELAAALAETERSYDATLSALSNALDVRDTETEGHARRVVQYLRLVADELGVPASERTVLLRGALLHDIGKIGVPDDILRKAGPLTSSEWMTMRRHPSYGARIIAGIPFLDSVAEIIKHHHERWDGTGYPDGLIGDEIPLGARMFSVADSFDAMTADRPYRRGMDAVSARAEILRHSGTQFDPGVVEAFMRIPLERLLRIAPHEAAQPVAEVAVVA